MDWIASSCLRTSRNDEWDAYTSLREATLVATKQSSLMNSGLPRPLRGLAMTYVYNSSLRGGKADEAIHF